MLLSRVPRVRNETEDERLPLTLHVVNPLPLLLLLRLFRLLPLSFCSYFGTHSSSLFVYFNGGDVYWVFFFH